MLLVFFKRLRLGHLQVGEVIEKPLVVDVPPSVPDGQRFVFDQKPGESGDEFMPVVVIAQQARPAPAAERPPSHCTRAFN